MHETPTAQSDGGLYVTWLGLLINLGLAFFKGVVGIIAQSSAMVADAGHSFSDVVSDLVTLWALRIARLPKDKNHPYGHGKFETIGALFVAAMLVVTGCGIVVHSFGQIEKKSLPGDWALIAAVVSILFKEILYHITMRVAKKSHSRVLAANAWHHRTDAISSILALVGIVGAQMGYPFLDPVAGILVSGWIIKTGVSIGYDSVKELTDEAIVEDMVPEIEAVVQAVDGVEHYHNLRARPMGPYVLVDVHVQVASHISVSAAHQIGERARLAVIKKIPRVNEVLIHIDAEPDLDDATSTLMRPQHEIEKDIEKCLSRIPEIQKISHILCHFLKERLSVQVEILVDPQMRVFEVQEIAKEARRHVEEIEDIHNADIHLELEDI